MLRFINRLLGKDEVAEAVILKKDIRPEIHQLGLDIVNTDDWNYERFSLYSGQLRNNKKNIILGTWEGSSKNGVEVSSIHDPTITLTHDERTYLSACYNFKRRTEQDIQTKKSLAELQRRLTCAL